jgi:PAS domain S-box-containing protein
MVDIDFTIIFNCLSESLVVLNLREEILYSNERAKKFADILNISLEPGTTFNHKMALHQEGAYNIVEQVIEHGVMLFSEKEYKDNDGRSHFLEFVYNPVRNDLKEIEFVCIMFHEITTQKTFEQRSTQLLRDFSTLIETANAVIFSIDSRAYVTEWNNECVRITGFDKNETLTKRIYPFIEGPVHLEFFVERILAGGPIGNFELHFKTKSGAKVVLLVNATPRLNAEGKVIGVLFVGQDITELSEYRRSLEQKVKDRTEDLKLALQQEKELVTIKNKFISIASDEFRIPLSSIASAANVIKTNPNLREEDTRKLETIEKHVAYMSELMKDVLTVGKTEAVRLKAHRHAFDLISFLNDVIEQVKIDCGNSHEVRLHSSFAFIRIVSDEKLLRNVFVNLLSNAVKFSPQSNVIELYVDKTETEIKITVVDYGIGIEEHDLEQIFEPFSRGSNAGSIQGTGLGLSIAKKAMEALEGNIRIKSEVAKGTQVLVLLKN